MLCMADVATHSRKMLWIEGKLLFKCNAKSMLRDTPLQKRVHPSDSQFEFSNVNQKMPYFLVCGALAF